MSVPPPTCDLLLKIIKTEMSKVIIRISKQTKDLKMQSLWEAVGGSKSFTVECRFTNCLWDRCWSSFGVGGDRIRDGFFVGEDGFAFAPPGRREKCCDKRVSSLFCGYLGWSLIAEFLGIWRNLERTSMSQQVLMLLVGSWSLDRFVVMIPALFL